jgi:hypothetical protein
MLTSEHFDEIGGSRDQLLEKIQQAYEVDKD